MNLKLFTLILAASISLVFCGPGGNIVIINKTPFTLVRGGFGAYQMPHWNFPRVISAYSEAAVYVEFAHSVGCRWEDDSAWVDYQYAGSSDKITIRSEHNFPPPNGHNPNLYSVLYGQRLDLGFRHNGAVILELTYGVANGMFEFRGGQ